MDAKEFLMRSLLLNEDINMDFLQLQQILESISRLERLETRTDLRKERVQGGELPSSPATKLIDQKIDLERTINEKVAENITIQEEINEAIRYCKDYDEIRVMKKRYLERKDWATISQEIGCSESKVYALHKSAMDKIEEFLKSKSFLE